MVNRILAVGALLLTAFSLSAQPWMASMQDNPNPNFFQIQKDFQEYWKDKDYTEKGKGFKQFKRWEWFWETRVNEDGTFPDRAVILNGMDEFNKMTQNTQGRGSQTANWTSLGPTSSTGGYAGIGRINCIAFHPTDLNTFWIGSPGGGLWKTTNGGTTWTTNTSNLPVLGISGIAIAPSNPNIMYIATGDGDAWDTYSVGVMKSTDGGATWNTTGLNWTGTYNNVMRRIIMDPNDESHLLVATSGGLYRTTNAGTTWTQVVTGDFHDVEAQPGAASNNFYASRGGSIYRSTDNGATWSLIQSIAGCNRIALGVTPANTSYVAALCSKSSDNGFLGYYSSVDAGATYALKSSTPNLLGWAGNGSDTGGQGWYDLVVTVDPTNADVIYTGGVNTWKSTNGGTTWTINTHWSGFSGAVTVHADKHALEWQNNTTLFQGNDGGIYKTTNGGTNWTDVSNTLVISQMYKLGVSQLNAAVITGLQDNGTKLRNNAGTWSDELGGDGMECAIDWSDANYMYGELYYGSISRSANAGASWTNITPAGSGNGAWVTPYIISPVTATTLYAGYTDVWKSTNRGTNWTQISTNIAGGSTLRLLAAAPSDANTIYAGTSTALYRTTNGGTSWTTMTVPGGGSLTYVAVHPTNASTIYATKSNYSAGQKVYKSTDGGATWTNISGTLPNLPVNCITYQTGSNDGLYVGMDIGVYYRDNSLSDWTAFSTGLPNVIVTELEIRSSTGKIRASTYGRGLWESDLQTGTLSVTPANQNVGTAAGSTSFTVTSDVSWTVTTSANWLTITPLSGSNNGTLNVNYTANTGANSRVGTITVTGSNGIVVTVTVTQAGLQVCTVYASTDVPKTIPTTVATITSTLNIPTGVTITDIDVVNLNITHTWINDLIVKIKSPAATERTLLSQICNSEDNIITNFDDEAGNAYSSLPCPPTGNLYYQPFQTLSNFDGETSTGVWTLTVSDVASQDGGTLNSWSLNVCYLPSTLSVSVSGTNVLCNGAATGTATATPTGGTPPYSYAWNNGGTTQTITGLVAGTYTVTVTATGGSTATGSVVITQPTALVVTTTGTNPTSGPNGSVTATATGGVAPYTYLWSNGATTQTISGLGAGTYTVTVTDANNCTATASATLVWPPLTVTITKTNASCNGAADGSATANANGGNGSYSYTWSNGATTQTISGLAAGTYTVTVTSASLSATASTTITEPPVLAATASSTNVSCFGGSDGSASVTASGGTGAYSYFWSNGATTASISNLAAANYVVTVTDANGCTATASTTISEPASALSATASSTNVSCNGGSDGSATATATGGTALYSYAWSNGATGQAIAGLAAGAYTVTVTDANGCTATASTNVSQPTSPLSVTVTGTDANNGNDGTATATPAGGTAPYSYAWSNGATTQTITGLVPGVYSVTVTDANNCTATGAVTISAGSTPLIVSASATDASCNGTADGTATAMATGGTGSYAYAWSNGGTTQGISNLPAGTYTVTVTSGAQTATASATVGQPTALTVAVSSANVTCNGANDGTASATATGGTGSISFAWSNGATTASISGLAPGTYTVTATDANGCSATGSATISQPSSLILSISQTNATCSGAANGTATASLSGGTAPYSYSWSNGATTATATGLAAGTYTVSASDANGCTSTGSVTITQPASAMNITFTIVKPTCFGGSNGTAKANSTGGTNPKTYLWSNGQPRRPPPASPSAATP